MANYAITTTPEQEEALVYYLTKRNQELAANNLPPITKADVVKDRFLDNIIQQANEIRADELNRVQKAFSEAPVAIRKQIRTLLGVD